MTPLTPENYFQFEKLLVELARKGVDYAVVGGEESVLLEKVAHGFLPFVGEGP